MRPYNLFNRYCILDILVVSNPLPPEKVVSVLLLIFLDNKVLNAELWVKDYEKMEKNLVTYYQFTFKNIILTSTVMAAFTTIRY